MKLVEPIESQTEDEAMRWPGIDKFMNLVEENPSKWFIVVLGGFPSLSSNMPTIDFKSFATTTN